MRSARIARDEEEMRESCSVRAKARRGSPYRRCWIEHLEPPHPRRPPCYVANPPFLLSIKTTPSSRQSDIPCLTLCTTPLLHDHYITTIPISTVYGSSEIHIPFSTTHHGHHHAHSSCSQRYSQRHTTQQETTSLRHELLLCQNPTNIRSHRFTMEPRIPITPSPVPTYYNLRRQDDDDDGETQELPYCEPPLASRKGLCLTDF